MARSVGCLSAALAVNVSIAAVAAYDCRIRVTTLRKTAFAIAAGPVDNTSACSRVMPVKAVSAPLLQETDQLAVIAGGLGQKPQPERARSVGGATDVIW